MTLDVALFVDGIFGSAFSAQFGYPKRETILHIEAAPKVTGLILLFRFAKRRSSGVESV
jgi:hypothetical protein